MRIDVIDVVDLPDGGANIIMDMDESSKEQFARIGILKVLTDAINDTLDYNNISDPDQLELDI
jgi:hypothetical protein